jgi:Lar family restriction alleviation protein
MRKGVREMTEELKPCPFCGGEASFTLTESRAGKWGFVKCGSCGATCNDDDVGDADWCVDVWNRRAPSASIADTAGAQSAEQERERFEADYAVVWNRSMHENGWASDHTADDVRALREGDTYGEGRDYLNARWEGWQARVALAAPPASSVADQSGDTEVECNCGSNPHAESCPVTSHVRALFAACWTEAAMDKEIAAIAKEPK